MLTTTILMRTASAVALVLLTHGWAGAASLTITATTSDRGIDVFQRDGVIDSLFGIDNALTVSAPPTDLLPESGGVEERAGTEFALIFLPSDITITSATLDLTLVSSLPAGDGAIVHGYTGNGAIEVADLNNVVNMVGGFAGPLAGTFAVDIDPAFLQSLVNSSSAFAGFAVWGAPGVGNSIAFTLFGTSASIPLSERPTLQIEYETASEVPEPTSILLVASGAVMLCNSGKKRRLSRTRVP
jgi:hypothetical protein